MSQSDNDRDEKRGNGANLIMIEIKKELKGANLIMIEMKKEL